MARVQSFWLKPEHERFRRQLEGALVDELYEHAKASQVSLLLVLVLLWRGLASERVLLPSVRGVLLGLIVLVVLRVIGLVVAGSKRGIWAKVRVRHRVFGAGALLTGVGLGALNVLSIPGLSPAHASLVVLCQTGVTSVGLVSLGASPAVYLLYMLPNLLPLMWLVALGHVPSEWHSLTPLLGVFISSLCVMAMRQFRSQRDNILMRLELAEVALVDSLTALRNRRYLHEFMEGEGRRMSQPRDGAPGEGACLMMVDIDHFKSINDRYGHDAGDVVLQQAAAVLRDAVRKVDLVVRWGGEEFVVVGRGVSIDDGLGLAERIRRQFAEHAFTLPSGEALRLTCSIGLSMYPFLADQEPLRWDDVLQLADVALYKAKQGGRNRVLALVGGPAPWKNGRKQLDEIKADTAGAEQRGLLRLLAA